MNMLSVLRLCPLRQRSIWSLEDARLTVAAENKSRLEAELRAVRLHVWLTSLELDASRFAVVVAVLMMVVVGLRMHQNQDSD